MTVKAKALDENLGHIARQKAVSISESSTVEKAVAVMREKKVPCLLLVKAGKLTGIFTERDYLFKVIGTADPKDPISRYMTKNPIVVDLGETVGAAAKVMNDKGLRHLPLIDKRGGPASVVTVDEIIEYLADCFPAMVVNRPPQPHLRAEETEGA
jgi:CBS domain-containing protein